MVPGVRFERQLWGEGKDVVVGMDEVGRGSWAGPLTMAAVVIPRGRRIYGVRDSKMLTPDKREAIYDKIMGWARHVGIGHADQRECDELGMSAAQRLAAQRALEALGATPDHVLVDGNWDFVTTFPATTIIKGDRRCLSIAAASIVAKVTRDRLMVRLSQHYPEYGFATNKGYPNSQHRAALVAFGTTDLHRKSWKFMDKLVGGHA